MPQGLLLRFPVPIVLLLRVLVVVLMLTACSRSVSGGACAGCHEGTHRDDVHGAQACTSCHAGDARRTDRQAAHAGLRAIPGNLSNAEAACGPCHAEAVERVRQSLMTTNAGMVAVNRFAFGELSHPGEPSSHGEPSSSAHAGRHGIAGLQPHTSAADSYFAQMCRSCHLGIEKQHQGARTGYEKGGGCLACHLDQGSESRLKKTPDDAACFLCHSRSARISLNYNGLAEVGEGEESLTVRTLPDGRRLKQLPADVHRQHGLQCVDCHRSADVMGDGHSHRHKEDAVQAQCEDCHRKPDHVDANHARLSCTSCHTSWAPNCFGCHIRYEKAADGAGRWIETEGETLYRPPTLGVTADGRVRPFVPGMKMTVDRSGFSGGPESPLHRVLFAPSFSHTVGKNARSCASCHSESTTLGFGEGKLATRNGRWTFHPAYRVENGLPEDAWIIPFEADAGAQPGAPLSTRHAARPLNPEEQKRILEVGLCLTCHPAQAPLFRDMTRARQHRHVGPLP